MRNSMRISTESLYSYSVPVFVLVRGLVLVFVCVLVSVFFTNVSNACFCTYQWLRFCSSLDLAIAYVNIRILFDIFLHKSKMFIVSVIVVPLSSSLYIVSLLVAVSC